MMVYVTCLLLSVMKREVLGQIIDPRTILKVLLVDYEEWLIPLMRQPLM